jgi:hypothetical protein
MENLLTLKQASEWIAEHYNKNTSPSQISYLMQYGHLKKIGNNGNIRVSIEDLKNYYDTKKKVMDENWNNHSADLNWRLSFNEYPEKIRTKHVHRLHPYKGKFIPQLVEYFIDEHVDDFKKQIYFRPGDIILDPFCGSGTTLVQANELGMNAIGIDVSKFNTQISNVKIQKHNTQKLFYELKRITELFSEYVYNSVAIRFENELLQELNDFNSRFFPSPDFKYQVRRKTIDEQSYSKKKEIEFKQIYENLLKKYNLQVKQDNRDTFIGKWYLLPVKKEIDYLSQLIKSVQDNDLKEVIEVILSRTVRSCRATTHSDLATLKGPVSSTYYCYKHYKICKPLFSMLNWWKRYSEDTLKRLNEFDYLRTNTYQICLTGDSRSIDLSDSLKKNNSVFEKILKQKQIKGIFSSPPYVGLIDYHEQHAYAYDIFRYERNDELEIGPLYKGKGKVAINSYIKGISDVLLNSKKYLSTDYHVFLVANDKFDLYPKIADIAGMKIVDKFLRPVLNRTEKDKSAYSETIFHIKEK